MNQSQNLFNAPNPQEFLEVFGIDPIEEIFQDSFYLYEFKDINGVLLQLSFNILERWVQTILSSHDICLSRVVYEGASQMIFMKENNNWVIKCYFESRGYQPQLTIQLYPNIVVHSSILVVEA